jgi:cyclopropane-fatty-acyl-phospholipid synthase
MEYYFQDLLKSFHIDKSEFRVIDSNFYNRLFKDEGDLSLFLGESYMAGEWESDDLASFFRKIISPEGYNKKIFVPFIKKYPLETSTIFFKLLKSEVKNTVNDYLYNNQNIKLSKRVGNQHYDIPDVLYKYMLDSQRQYTCGYWKPNTKTLEKAQRDKINLIIDKLQIPDNAEMNILDIGCGWGGLTHAILKRYPKCNVDGISISREQIKFANKKYKNDKLRYFYCDYRDLPNRNKKYHRIVSVGMFEHVGLKNFGTFFEICENILTHDGIFLLHTITRPHEAKNIILKNDKHAADSWIDKYIFPGGYIPMAESILASSQDKKLIYHHIQNLSISYAKTLNAWYNNFTSNWSKIRKSNPDFFTDRFYKMWKFYLLSSMVQFEKKNIQLTQFIFTKKKYNGMYIFVEKDKKIYS